MSSKTSKVILYNKLDRDTLIQHLNEESFSRKTLSFYKYMEIQIPQDFRDKLFRAFDTLNCFGRIYIAREGINAQMSIPGHNWSSFLELLQQWEDLKNIPLKIAIEDNGKSFFKLSIKVRKQIVADGLTMNDYDVTNVGKHLDANSWNDLLINEESIVVDMRNHYESEIGHFEGSILPQSETFREELPEVLSLLKGKENNPVLLYCTGGIRCEKTSAFLKHHGFHDVNQLHGGIIDYARQVNEKGIENKFRGKNFVFDERLGESISQDVISNCHQCGEPNDTHVNCANQGCNLLFIQCKDCQNKMAQTCSNECQKIINLPEDEQAVIRRKKGLEKKAKRHYRSNLFKK
ncbi:MAG: Thiosulfate sulfurtransferase GlpE [Owenweeksia sp. TMED14]|nr:MAG: Thiosulfate sulfurtransferase GlpE [Owenweeksia sp. TMED14]|tara:strand:- start:1603 stop:2646 length:1044 start_codon:yes stop_codon:yes gene_type:complete